MGAFFKINLLWSLLTIPLGLVHLYFLFFKRKPKLDLKNKVVFITGASSGLGEACVKAFFEAGCRVILSGRDQGRLEAVRDQLLQTKSDRAKDIACVVMDIEDVPQIPGKVQEATDCFGHVDIVINNAGISYRGQGSETSLEIYQKLMNVNLFGHIHITKAFLPQMMKRKSGHIVAIGSIQSVIAIPNRTAYAASKHALAGYFDSLRAELSLYNIDVCVVHPYYIKTNLSKNAVCSDGRKYGKLDDNTEKGMSASYAAGQIVECVVRRVEDRLLCPLHIHLAVCLRTMVPSLFFKLMENRAKKESISCKKTE